jgi:ubiquitin carboxyl-terminal hydrolase 5/13
MERAVEWLFSHPPEEDVPMTGLEAFDTNANATPVQGGQKVAGHEGGPAGYKLQSVVMHKGASVHAGHYVAFIYKEIPGVGEDWVLFNDEKVVKGGDWNEVYKTGYVYFFRRV